MPDFYQSSAAGGGKTAALCGAVAVLLLLPGCGRQAPPPQTERMDLVARFFASVKSRDFNAAMRQGVKLRSLDGHNENIARLIEIQQCNAYVGTAQKMVNSGDIRGAIAVLEKGVRRYPDNIALREILPRVRQLRNARNLIIGMEQASNSIAMRSALTAAKIGLAANETPALRRYFTSYGHKLAAVERQEKILEERKARSEAAEKARLAAAEKAKKQAAEKTRRAAAEKAKKPAAEKTGQAAAKKGALPREPKLLTPEKVIPAASPQKPSTVSAGKK